MCPFTRHTKDSHEFLLHPCLQGLSDFCSDPDGYVINSTQAHTELNPGRNPVWGRVADLGKDGWGVLGWMGLWG